MKNFLLLLTFVLVAALPGKVNAQCACAGTDYASINVAGWTVGQSGTITTVQYAGERATIQNTVAGATYRVASCGASYDSQLTIYTTGCGYVAYNDDNGPACTGNKASVDFVSPGGNLYSKLNVFNCGTNSTSTTVTITLLSLPCTVQGNPATYPTGQWNAYVWNAGNANGDAGAWTNNYSGYYVISATSFDTRQGQTLSTPQSWGENNSPSNASGYLGCAVGIDNHSYAFRRTGLGADGWWRLTIPTHDDESRLFVNGGQVWQHDNACCDLHTNAYTGWITSGTTLDYRVSEGGGGSHGSMDWCLMAGDNSYGTYPTWNAYVYDNQSINDNDYQGWFTETGSGTTLISDNFGTGQPIV
ncbi:MAG: hypothetical protein M0D57_21840 [Sphingobacteriales bacterium JAD_PAG50586_3]|nr:MAG: hypothetical protein M0D57_21840 [Sphingobacteriales bacterium JAD_PAG50586_3]